MSNPTDCVVGQINKLFQKESDRMWLPEPKTREDKQNELEDVYSNKLYDMTDEELDEEYKEKML